MSIPVWPIIGGMLIGISAILLMWFIGRIAGISGILWGALNATHNDKLWRWLFLAGLISGTFLFHSLSGQALPEINANYPLAMLAGLIVGIGVKLGSGCTSGHGVCGIGRLSIRSLVATITFMVTAIITVAVFNALTGA